MLQPVVASRVRAGATPPVAPGRLLAALACIALFAGCATERPLMPTPAVYALGMENALPATLPAPLRGSRVEVLYATDRVPAPRPDGRLDYGIGRDPALAVGTATVQLGEGATWEELEADARSEDRARSLDLVVDSVTELERTPEFPLPYTVIGDNPVVTPDARARLDAVAAQVREGLRQQLVLSPRKEVLMYVHGVANSFDDAIATTAELWHYMGREFVPVAYTWPAGRGGVLRGYTYDRESSEFTIFHFKRLLAWVASLPEIEGIHIIAHSRGTDVVNTGLRELVIEGRARGDDLRKTLKLRNVVLAAPDLDVQILMQRTGSEYVGIAIDRITIYSSPHDEAIGIADFLFGSVLRLGQADFENVQADFRGLLEGGGQGNAALIEYVGERGGAFGHNYFRTNPAVSSDLVLTVRYGRGPGAENGRPLKHVGGIFWRIDDKYPKPPQP